MGYEAVECVFKKLVRAERKYPCCFQFSKVGRTTKSHRNNRIRTARVMCVQPPGEVGPKVKQRRYWGCVWVKRERRRRRTYYVVSDSVGPVRLFDCDVTELHSPN